jgi:hypothetical protein
MSTSNHMQNGVCACINLNDLDSRAANLPKFTLEVNTIRMGYMKTHSKLEQLLLCTNKFIHLNLLVFQICENLNPISLNRIYLEKVFSFSFHWLSKSNYIITCESLNCNSLSSPLASN